VRLSGEPRVEKASEGRTRQIPAPLAGQTFEVVAVPAAR
jgi:hypothetical protein